MLKKGLLMLLSLALVVLMPACGHKDEDHHHHRHHHHGKTKKVESGATVNSEYKEKKVKKVKKEKQPKKAKSEKKGYGKKEVKTEAPAAEATPQMGVDYDEIDINEEEID